MIIHHYHPETLLKVMGEDAAGFLQGQFTNELRQPVGAAVYGLWLNQKGKVLADSHVLKLAANEFRVMSITSKVEVIRTRLEDYIIADDVTLADETELIRGLAVAGEGSGGLIKQIAGAVPPAGQFVQAGSIAIFAGRRRREENYELIGSVERITELKSKLLAQGGREAGAEEMECARIAAGVPAIPGDLGPGDLPNEGGLEEGAISFTKGCYLGQEVMARLKNLGQVRRRLQVVRGAGAPPQAPAPLFQGGVEVGQIRSVARRGGEFVALAMFSLVKLDPATGLSLSPDATPTMKIIPHG